MSRRSDPLYQKRLAAHLRRLAQATPGVRADSLDEAVSGLESATGRAMPGGIDLHRMAAELDSGTRPPAEVRGLEAIILPKLRPVLDVSSGTFEVPSKFQTFYPQLARDPSPVRKALPAIGRVNVVGIPGLPYAGTGFLVGEGVLMTNRHVAELFVLGLGDKARLRFVSTVTPSIDLNAESGATKPKLLRVIEALLIHPFWDMALL